MDVSIGSAIALAGAAIAMGIGTVGPAIAQGMIGSKSCENIGKYPESYTKIRLTMIIALSVVETCAIYALVVALFVIGKVGS